MVKICRPLVVALILLGGILSAGCAGSSAATDSLAPSPAGESFQRAALEAALRGYEQESLKPLESMLPAPFIGRSVLLDAARSTLNEQKQIRIRLTDVNYQPGEAPQGSLALSAHWEKRFLKLPGLLPTAETGTLKAVMHLESGQWVIDTLSPDNPFVR